jgi:hypothetical protein
MTVKCSHGEWLPNYAEDRGSARRLEANVKVVLSETASGWKGGSFAYPHG